MKTIFIVDYDGCGEVWSDDYEQSIKKAIPTFTGDVLPAVYEKHLNIRDLFTSYLQQLAGASTVELYVGSLRQSHFLDAENAKHFSNGSCFDCYKDVATKLGWQFNPFLLADVVDEHKMPRDNPLPPGTAMGDGRYHTMPDKTKENLFKAQLKDILSKKTAEDLNIYYIDDDPENNIFPVLSGLISQESSSLPKHININLIQFSWHDMLIKAYSLELSEKQVMEKIDDAFMPFDKIRSLLHSLNHEYTSVSNYRQNFFNISHQCRKILEAKLLVYNFSLHIKEYVEETKIDRVLAYGYINQLESLSPKIKSHFESTLTKMREIRKYVDEIENAMSHRDKSVDGDVTHVLHTAQAMTLV